MGEPSKIVRLLTEVGLEVGAIRKSDRNQQQSYSFRGIDAVTKAVHGPLLSRGILVTSEIVDKMERTDIVERSGNRNPGRPMTVWLHMRYTFSEPEGSSITSDSFGLSIDYQDKAGNQAMSQALKMCLLQVLLSPTDEPDADSKSPHMDNQQASEPATREKPTREEPEPEPVQEPFGDEFQPDAIAALSAEEAYAFFKQMTAISETGWRQGTKADLMSRIAKYAALGFAAGELFPDDAVQLILDASFDGRAIGDLQKKDLVSFTDKITGLGVRKIGERDGG